MDDPLGNYNSDEMRVDKHSKNTQTSTKQNNFRKKDGNLEMSAYFQEDKYSNIYRYFLGVWLMRIVQFSQKLKGFH